MSLVQHLTSQMQQIMSLLVLCICGYLLKITTAETTVNISVLENNSATFTFTYEHPAVSNPGHTVWDFRKQPYSEIYFNPQTKECLNSGFTEDESQYSIFCNTTQVSLTVKSVNRSDHNTFCNAWIFGGGSSSRVHLYIYIIVPVQSVEIINISKTNVSMAEHQKTTLECKASASWPIANIEWRNGAGLVSSLNATTIITQVKIVEFGLTAVTSTLSLFPDKTMNGNNLSCSGNNYLNEWYSDWIILNVTYMPGRPVTIEGLQNGQTVSIFENKRVSLNCTIGESNPPANLNWNCTNVTLFTVSDWNYTAKLLQMQASRNNIPVCRCSSTYLADNLEKTEVMFNVLYPATINQLFSNGLNISKKQLNVIENDTVHVECDAEGNPLPTFRWALQNEHYSYSRNITLDNVRRNTATTKYSCIAANVMHDFTGTSIQGNDSTDFTLNVLYPPSIHALHNLSVIEGNSTYVNCTIIPGNPSAPTDIRWIHSSGKDSVLYINRVNRSDSRVYTCVANNTMNTSYGVIRYGVDNRNINVQVLYPPEDITIISTTIPNHKVFDMISLIENTSLELICSAKGNPMPSFFSWSGIVTSDGDRVYVHTSNTNRGGNITCLAKNVMTELPQFNTFIGANTKTILVDVLYPPEVNLTDRNVIEGEDVNISCVETPGKVSYQSISWISHHTIITNNNSLIVRNVTRQHAGKCTCMVNYTMIPTYGENKSDSIIGVVYLDVLYKAEISNFFVDQHNQNIIVTVNESDNVRMVCILESNPDSTMHISLRNKIVSINANTKILEYFISRSSCTDTGNYVCSGYNILNANRPSTREIRVFVNCSPRRSPFAEVKSNVTVSQEGFATFSFFTLAYPPPLFKWFRKENLILVEANNGYSKVLNISENEMRIDFVLVNVSVTDYGEYILTINNTFGGHQQTFFLQQMVPTSTEGERAERSSTGLIAGVAVGSVLGTLVVVAAFYIICSRLRGKQLNQTNIPSAFSLSPVYQNETKDGYTTNTVDGDIANVYEKLENADSDQHYQELTMVVSAGTKGQRDSETASQT